MISRVQAIQRHARQEAASAIGQRLIPNGDFTCEKDICDPGQARYGLFQQLQPLAPSDAKPLAKPVMLLSGRAMLLPNRPYEVGSRPPTNTIGMSDVRC
jgi:hypothetical protein